MKKTIMTLMSLAILTMGASTVNAQKVQKAQEGNNEMKKKVEQYAPFVLKYDIGQLSREEAELVGIFIQIADVMDDIYWEQAFGQDNRKRLRELKDPYMRQFAEIQYGAWDRLDAERPFIPGYGPKPAGANFYPKDMTKEEFEKLDDPMKTSQYTILQRNGKGDLEVIPYHKAYEKYLKRVYELLDKAIELAKDDGLRKYLETRREALSTDNYFESDMMWMDMKDSRLDIVFGPIENYEDALYGYKTAYEAFVLIKDEKWSNDLARFTKMLPELQKQLPCDPKYKKEVPGTESDLNVYDVIYYAGDCNAGSKTIAINLPNDEKVQLKKGSRRLQLKNAMEAKFQNILVPIANLMISKEQLKNIKFDAFFSNVCYHEVAHGLGIKNTVTGKGNVRQALKNQYSAWEEAKADICGLYIVQTLIERGEIKGITVEDAYVTYLAGLLRSVRFGATEAHGIANMMCFNYMQDKGAFTRNKEGKYVVDSKKMRAALESWAALVIKTEGEGDYDAAKAYADKNGKVRPDLAKDLKAIEKANIPLDIRYEQGAKVLGLEQAQKTREMKNDIKAVKTQKPLEYKK
ncbi:MAG: Zn-dependent hydrolase [Bacteroidales bacterium]|nr:Zn-dependent hydrolase [Bacteroidales bacterium]